jgi:DegV family protein with EDD domain
MTASGLVAVVTDSTASLPPIDPWPTRVIVVPLRLLAGELLTDDGAAGAAGAIEAAAARGERLTTARPVPARFTAAYQAAADVGATAILSVHVSGSLSGTISSAALAAAGAPVPVLVLDSRTIGSGLGLVVLAAAAAARAGLGLDAVAAAARRCAEQTGSLVAVDVPTPCWQAAG